MSALILTRKLDEKIRIGDDIVITVVRVGLDKVRLRIEAPDHVPIVRPEAPERCLMNEEQAA